ncbi:hypothetical protein Poli38472_000399 [Pythium oligandrum]|uniref:Uncharacterized protein n=1 Tax=Pythium oligandrum TaxID=41045 RepID=A0A8K1CDN4_PYTOL|nr:hypothetical protein Poli38472_000399 [Pythium oligandrum]|eukprot:TMW60357.1 hypothetical protein Poli38472_000399 [Pythium oligandrum]
MSVTPPYEVIQQGYLHKQSKHLKVWKVRYFILTKLELLYAKKSGKKTKLCAKIQDAQVIDDQNAVMHVGNYVIEVRAGGQKIYLSATTEQERLNWVMMMRSLQSEGSSHSATFVNGGSDTVSLLRRPASDTMLSLAATPTGRRKSMRRRKSISKERREERKRRVLPKLKKSFSEVWLEDLLVQTDRKDSPLVEALCFAGIPKELRGRVWSWVLGNKLQVNEELFLICKARALAVQQEMSLKKEADTIALKSVNPGSSTSLSSGGSCPQIDVDDMNDDLSELPILAEEKEDGELNRTMLYDAVDVAEKLVARGERSIRLVGVDMPRTFGHHPLFQTGTDGTTRTTEVLEAYICYRPDLGYVQGMSYLAAALCFHMDSFTAFKAMVSLLSNSVLFDMFRMEAKRTFHYIGVYDRILEHELPRLHAHFQNNGIDAQMYAVDWALTLFTRSLPLNLALRIWDCFVLLGTPFFFQASMGILSLFEERMLAMQPEEMMRFLHHIPKTTSSTDLFTAIDSVSLSCAEITAILAGEEARPWTPDSGRHIEVKYPETYD